MKKMFLAAAVMILGVLLFTACHKTNTPDGPFIPAGDPPAGGEAGPPAKGTSPVGVWYEQEENGGILEITEGTVSYRWKEGVDPFAENCSFKKEGKLTLIETEDFFFFEDMSYDQEKDIVNAYTMSHTDGDGGHNYVEFRREVYVAPPAPTYAPPVDHSDPGAKTAFDDLTVSSMKLSFYDEGMTYDVNSSMAREEPYPDEYSYDLKVLEDGTGLVSSSFCQEIELTKEKVEELQELVRNADLGQINGVDIHTAGLPYGSPEYEAEIVLASGETIRSSANGDNVPAAWKSFQEPAHHLLYFAFRDAGYHTDGQFHSTKPMKRVQASDRTYREGTGFSRDNLKIVAGWKKSWEYSLDTSYFIFTDPANRYPNLMKTLDSLSAAYKKTAEETLQKDYEMMEKLPRSTRKKAERKYCYSLYAVDNWELNGRCFQFSVEEGHANSFGVGEYGHGKYRTHRYAVDVTTGKLLTLGDLFVSPEAVSSFLSERMVSRYGTHNASGKRVHEPDFPEAVAKAVRQSGPEGISWNVGYDGLTLWMPRWMFPTEDSDLMEVIYYDELQDILGDKYTEVW